MNTVIPPKESDWAELAIGALSESERLLLEQYLSPQTNIDELYGLLSDKAGGAQLFGFERIGRGRQILSNLRADIVSKICSDYRIRATNDYATAQFNDQLAMAAVIAGLLGSNPAGTAINAVLVAALVTRIGVRKLCRNQE